MVLQGKGYIVADLSTLYYLHTFVFCLMGVGFQDIFFFFFFWMDSLLCVVFSVWVSLLFDNLFSHLFVQFSSVQFKIVSMCSEKPICAPPHLSEVSPVLPLNR